MKLRRIREYPVKSLRGYDVDAAQVRPWGLDHDRRWAVLEPDGTELTAREHPPMLLVHATPTEDGLLLQATGRPDHEVARPVGGTSYKSDSTGPTVAADDAANRWLSETLGRPVVLVHQQDASTDRAVKESHGGLPGDRVSLADTAPLLLTTEASLRRLDQLLAQTAQEYGEPTPAPLSMVRFRPNLVVDGDRPFAEHDWPGLRIGEVELRFAENCDRCVMPTYDPDTLAHGHEPTRTLARHRRWGGKVWFGIRLIPVTTGVVRLGDEVTVLGGPPNGRDVT
jgi:uncharacterized protein YcbX